MPDYRPNIFIRICVAVVALGLLSAFSYPLVQEGYAIAGQSEYKREQLKLIEQSIASYLRFRPATGWSANTPTRQIFSDLELGFDRDMDGRKESFLPASQSAESLSRQYRVMYKSPENFKVIPR